MTTSSMRIAPRWLDPTRLLPRNPTPERLGSIRIIVSAILLMNVMWEDLPSTALLPREMRTPMGVLNLLGAGAGGMFDRFTASGTALLALQIVTGLALLLAMLGWRCRVTVPLAAACYLLMAGIFRHYVWFYHTGIVPLYALIVLSFTPCGDGWSIDAWRRKRRRFEPARPRDAELYAWSIYAVWVVIAIAYMMAGGSKLRRGGLEWFHPDNFRAILFTDTLKTMHFDWQLSLRLIGAPNWIFVALAIAAVAGELAYGLVLVSRPARIMMPIVMTAMHVGIWLMQNVLFFDLILIQLVFCDWPRWIGAGRASRAALAPRAIDSPRSRVAPWVVGTMAVALALVWAAKFEYFPLTDMHMYTDVNTSGVIEFTTVSDQTASGQFEDADPSRSIGAMADGRYRRILNWVIKWARGEKTPEVSEQFFATCARIENAHRAPDNRIVRYEVRRWRWDMKHPPLDGQFGNIMYRVQIDLDPPRTTRLVDDSSNPENITSEKSPTSDN